MIKLLAKNKSDGRYYFSEDDISVYLIKSPLAKSEKVYVDPLTVFQRKSFDSDLTFDEQEFTSMEELRAYAIQDCDPVKRGVSLKAAEPNLDILVYAPVQIVEKFLKMIEDMIDNKKFKGLNLFFEQLSRSYELRENKSLADKKDELMASFEKAIFEYINEKDKESVSASVKRIQDNCSVLYPMAS